MRVEKARGVTRYQIICTKQDFAMERNKRHVVAERNCAANTNRILCEVSRMSLSERCVTRGIRKNHDAAAARMSTIHHAKVNDRDGVRVVFLFSRGNSHSFFANKTLCRSPYAVGLRHISSHHIGLLDMRNLFPSSRRTEEDLARRSN
jgi:hypothetical protein